MTSSKSIYQANFREKKLIFDTQNTKVWADDFYAWLFCMKKEYVDFANFQAKEIELKSNLKTLILPILIAEKEADKLVNAFFAHVEKLHQILHKDLVAILNFDPAAKSKDEILNSYPGFYATAIYRVAHFFYLKNIAIFPRFLSEYAHSQTGIDIHPGAKIGEAFFIDHGTGVVIGETAIIGKHVKIYQGVTLGALSVSKDKAEKKRHPTIEDSVSIYANATILGGNTVIGKNAVIGGNVWITESIEPNALVFNTSENIIKQQKQKDIIDFTI
jgi:serine O-acetyltransferase